MKTRTEKQPVDDLFARKLKTMSLPPRSDGFARLQARMEQGQQQTRIVVWRNPAIQRYIAVAACLLLVCLFGWLYLSNDLSTTNKDTVAFRKSAASPSRPNERLKVSSETELATTQPVPERQVPEQQIPQPIEADRTHPPLTGRTKSTDSKLASANRQVVRTDRLIRVANPVIQDRPTGMPVKSSEQIAKAEVNGSLGELTIDKQAGESMAGTATNKPASAAERVLVVTIAEPEVLVTARRSAMAVTTEKDVVAVVDKSEKETKTSSIWQQVKRLKQGDVFARKDAGEEERGLLGRAYNGLKQTFDKDKSIKQ